MPRRGRKQASEPTFELPEPADARAWQSIVAASWLMLGTLAVFLSFELGRYGENKVAQPWWVSVVGLLSVAAYSYWVVRFRWPVPTLGFAALNLLLGLVSPDLALSLLYGTCWPLVLSLSAVGRTRLGTRAIDAAALVCAAASGWSFTVCALLLMVDSAVPQRLSALFLVLPGVFFLFIALCRQRALARWLGRVRRNQVSGWRLIRAPALDESWLEDWLFVRPFITPTSTELLIAVDEAGRARGMAVRLACREPFGCLRSVALSWAMGALRFALPAIVLGAVWLVAAVASEGERYRDRFSRPDPMHAAFVEASALGSAWLGIGGRSRSRRAARGAQGSAP